MTATLIGQVLMMAAVGVGFPVERGDLHTRDPYVVVDREKGKYLLFTTYYIEPGLPGGDYFGMTGKGVQLYESTDLEHWSEPHGVLDLAAFGVESTAVWAPEVHEYNGRWYIFTTLNYANGKRGTWTFVADDVRGPYSVMKKKSITPEGWCSLDGTLWVEDGRPYMVFCHEWVDVGDGEVCIVPLSDDLSEAAGEVTTLFRQSDAPGGLTKVRITDGPFLSRRENGELWMIWSTVLENGNYCVYKVRSESGKVMGPWKDHQLMFGDNGGHGMVFRDLEGALRLSLHSGGIWDERPYFLHVDEDWNVTEKIDVPKGGYVFAYFSNKEYGGRSGESAGLHLAWSEDGLGWTPVNEDRPILVPEVGPDRLMRDPSIARSDAGVFHLVWTTGWKGREIGHSSSVDLIHWRGQKAVPVMESEPEARNTWAPEVTFNPDEGMFYVYWASTIPGRHSPIPGMDRHDDGLNHRIYMTRTWDFNDFSPTALWFNPDFSVIDASMLYDRKAKEWLMFVKNENAEPVEKNIRMVRTDSPKDGFDPKGLGEPITDSWTEGPTSFWVGDDIYLFYDRYNDGCFGAKRSHDRGRTWEDITDRVKFPPEIRHGTVFPVTANILEGLRRMK